MAGQWFSDIIRSTPVIKATTSVLTFHSRLSSPPRSWYFLIVILLLSDSGISMKYVNEHYRWSLGLNLSSSLNTEVPKQLGIPILDYVFHLKVIPLVLCFYSMFPWDLPVNNSCIIIVPLTVINLRHLAALVNEFIYYLTFFFEIFCTVETHPIF